MSQKGYSKVGEMHLCVDIPLFSNSQASTWGCHEWAYGTIWRKVNPTTGGGCPIQKEMGHGHTREERKGADWYDNIFQGNGQNMLSEHTPTRVIAISTFPFLPCVWLSCSHPCGVQHSISFQLMCHYFLVYSRVTSGHLVMSSPGPGSCQNLHTFLLCSGDTSAQNRELNHFYTLQLAGHVLHNTPRNM